MFKVVEMFESINGEGYKAGQLAYFVRFQGCNMNCVYCDTKWANKKDALYQLMSAQDIVSKVNEAHIKNVTLTGGEPMLQEEIEELIRLLYENGHEVEIETNGSIDISSYDHCDYRPSFTLDYKCPDSGMEKFVDVMNYDHIQEKDTIKFVCSSRIDLKKAYEIIEKYALNKKAHVYLSPVFGKIDPQEMVAFMLEKNMNDVNLQLQMHKFIWDPEERGV